MDSCSAEIRRRAKYYHFFVGKSSWETFLHRALLVPQILLGVNRLRHKNVEIYYGSNWCSLSHELLGYLLEQKKLCRELFCHVSCGDELFVQTMAVRGGFPVYSGSQDRQKSICRYIDWEEGKPSPKILQMVDYDKLISGSACFARKFDCTQDRELILRILDGIKELP